MSVRDAIMAEIIAHPESDELRGVFADAISSEDPEWSTHIMESMSSDWLVARREPSEDLKTRIRRHLGRFAELGGRIERGFVAGAVIPVAIFVEHGEEILKSAPIIGVTLVGGPEPFRNDWSQLLPPVLRAPALRLVRALSLGSGRFDFGTMCQLIRSPNIERLITFDGGLSIHTKPELEAEMWELLFESSVFRGMIDWGLGMHPHRGVLGWMDQAPLWKTQRSVGDSIRIGRRDSDYYTITSYTPMPLEDRALEEKYGYIPRLHAGNWDATVLDVLRGVKPDFPVGARPVPEMYAVPPEKSEKNHGLDF